MLANENLSVLDSEPPLAPELLQATIEVDISPTGVSAVQLSPTGQTSTITLPITIPLSSIPQWVCSLPSLKTLTVMSTPLSQLPPNFSKLCSTLTSLSLIRTQIKNIPNDLFSNFSLLKYLELSNNLLTSIPEIKNLSSIETLIVSGNKEIYQLPGSIGDLNKLTRFEAVGCSLSDLPTSMFNSYSLKTLLLSSNQFTTLPSCISSLANNLDKINLNSLHLDRNYISDSEVKLIHVVFDSYIKDLRLDNQLAK